MRRRTNLPTLKGTASAQHGASGGDIAGNALQAAANGNWVPDVFGANRRALNAAIATAQASTASLDDMQVSCDAIGALEGEVLLQFLIEAVVLSALGGAVGIVIATGAS